MLQVPIYTSRPQGTKSASPHPPPPPPNPTYERNPTNAKARESPANAAEAFYASDQIGGYKSPPTSSPFYYKPHTARRLKKSVIIPPHYQEAR